MLKGIFFDISGVLLDGANLIPNADKALNLIKQNGLPFRLLTNTSQQTCDMLLKQLNEAGLEIIKDEVYTAPLAAKDYIQGKNHRPYCLIHPNLMPESAALDQSNPNAVVIGDDIYGDISGVLSAGMELRLVRTDKYRDGDEQKVSPTATVVVDVLQAVTDLIT